MGCRIHAQIAKRDDRVGTPGVTAEHRAHARAEFVEVEWLHQVVVGTTVESEDPVGDRIAGGDHQYRDAMGCPPELGEQFEAGFSGEAEVEQQHLVAGGGQSQFGGPAHRAPSRPCGHPGAGPAERSCRSSGRLRRVTRASDLRRGHVAPICRRAERNRHPGEDRRTQAGCCKD
jgi:hypothetical protein